MTNQIQALIDEQLLLASWIHPNDQSIPYIKQLAEQVAKAYGEQCRVAGAEELLNKMSKDASAEHSFFDGVSFFRWRISHPLFTHKGNDKASFLERVGFRV